MTLPSAHAYDPSRTRYLRGSTEQCPKCGSRKVTVAADLKVKGYGPGIASCDNCKTLWEPFDPADIWDTNDPHCSFREPCNNCAFRPGSPEQADRKKWRETLAQLKEGGTFNCHKGVPITDDGEHGFAYPTKTVSGEVEGVKFSKEIPDIKRLRTCRGYLRAMGKWWKRETTGTMLDEMTEADRQEVEQANTQSNFPEQH